MSLSIEEKIELLKVEFPNLSLTDDSDIERYFDLRKNGFHQEALRVYNGAIRRKYPDDGTRILLLRYYRAHDPRFAVLLKQNLLQRADSLVVRYKRGIDFLTKDIENLNMRDAYSVIRVAESIVQVLSRDRYEAIALAEKYVSFARKFSYKYDFMQKTANLVRQYLSGSVDSIEALKKEQEIKRSQKARNQEIQQPKKNIFDLSKLTFSNEDLQKIIIPAQITRMEDKVLAFCLKYWNKVFDSAFEKTIFLYSKKYNTNHYSVFEVIKIGRSQKRRDGDILTSVLGTLTSGYFYSVQGDIYLQQMWRKLRGQDEQPTHAITQQVTKHVQPVALNSPKETAKLKKPELKQDKQIVSRTEKTKQIKNKNEHTKPTTKKDGESTIIKEEEKTAEQATIKQVSLQVAKEEVVLAIKSVKNKKNTNKEEPTKFSAKIRSQRKVILNTKEKGIAKSESLSSSKFVKPVEAQPIARTQMSIASIIKGVSGKSYDLYKDSFLDEISPFIRKELIKTRRTQPKFFDFHLRKAEEVIYDFMAENYSNPFMNWEESQQRQQVSALGYEVTSLVPIISNWYKARR